jgi:regulatory protein
LDEVCATTAADDNPDLAEAVTAAWDKALNLLARREHSVRELQLKLLQRGFTAETVETVLARLVVEELLSETRYAESYTRMRAGKGYGPLRIYQELRERGIDKEIIEQMLEQHAGDWPANLERAHNKRFGSPLPAGGAERLRRLRFLQQRGFSLEQINRFFDGRFKSFV